MLRKIVFECISVVLMAVSIYFFFTSMEFLASQDYVAGILAILVGLSVIRMSMELMRIVSINQEQE